MERTVTVRQKEKGKQGRGDKSKDGERLKERKERKKK